MRRINFPTMPLTLAIIAALGTARLSAQQAMTEELRNIVLYNAPYIIAETPDDNTVFEIYGNPSGYDHLLAVDFDNDYLGRNNTGNAANGYIPRRIPTVYYSIEETSASDGTGFYYIGYYFYHPRDRGFTVDIYTNGGHQHDMEGVFLIVRKTSWNPYGTPVLAWSEAHGALIPYYAPGFVDPNTALSEGNSSTWGGEIVFRFDADFGKLRPVVAIAQSTHGTYMAQACGPTATPGVHRDGYGYDISSSGNAYRACIHQGRSWISYQPATDSYPFVGLADSENYNTYNYRLVELATSPVWQYRSSSGDNGLFTGATLDLGHGLRGADFFTPLFPLILGLDAHPPWAWRGGPGEAHSFLGIGGHWYSFGQDGTGEGEGHGAPWPTFLPGELLVAPQNAAYRFFPHYGYSGFNEPVVFSAFYSANPPPPPPQELTVSISGPNVVWTGHSASWSAVVSYGTPPYTYQWSGDYMGSSTQSTFSGNVFYPFTLYLDVWDAVGAHVAMTKDVDTSDCWPNVC